jgi:hypothetical protein
VASKFSSPPWNLPKFSFTFTPGMSTQDHAPAISHPLSFQYLSRLLDYIQLC